jgi:tetratricopeptide (TPR) repeat protein
MTKEKGLHIPPSMAILYDRASKAIDEKDYDYAIRLLQSSLSINPNFSKARALLIVARTKKLQVSSLTHRQIKGIALLFQAFFLENLKKWDGALEKYEYLLSILPPQAPILPRMGDIYLQKGIVDRAIQAYRATLELQQDNLYTLLRLTKLLREKGETKEAVEHCRRYLRVKPNDFTVMQELKNLEALIVIDKGKWEEKSSFVEAATRKELKEAKDKIGKETTPKIDIESALQAAETFLDQNRWDDAISEYEKATVAAPDNIRAHQSLGELYIRGRHFEKAIEEYEKVVSLDPKKKAALDTLANLYIRKGDTARAIEKYKEIIKIAPSETTTYRSLGDLYLKNGDVEKALENYRRVAELDPENLAIHIILGDLYLKREELTKAIEEYRKQVTLEPTNPIPIEQLGDLYLKEGEFEKAKESYLKAAKLEPTKESLVKKIKEVELAKHNALLRHYELLLKSNPEDKELKEKIIELKEDRLKMRIANCKEKLKENPGDASLRLELGKLYLEGERLNEAVVEFQACLNESSLRQRALYFIGAVLEKKGMLDMAAAQLEKALASGTGLVDEQTKEILYKLGNIYEITGDRKKALSFYKKIYETDIAYKDVAKKVESSYL